jgi:putative sigma-54 modulation protein
MKIDIVGRNYAVSERLKGLIEKKVGKLDRFFEKPASAKIVCTANKDRQKMEINLSCGKMFVRSEVETDNMYSNLDVCVAKLEKQVIKFLGKANVKAKAIDFIQNLLIYHSETHHPKME